MADLIDDVVHAVMNPASLTDHVLHQDFPAICNSAGYRVVQSSELFVGWKFDIYCRTGAVVATEHTAA